MSQEDEPLDVLAAVIERAKAAGADAADAVLIGDFLETVIRGTT